MNAIRVTAVVSADGFDNRIEACYFSSNKVGLILARAANGVHVCPHQLLCCLHKDSLSKKL
eukprot:SAG31_NODE_126_length_23665_cov_6.178987_11_plen_61_part_00